MFVSGRSFDGGVPHEDAQRIDALAGMGGIAMAEHVRSNAAIEAQLTNGGMHRALQRVNEQVIANLFAGARMVAMAGCRLRTC